MRRKWWMLICVAIWMLVVGCGKDAAKQDVSSKSGALASLSVGLMPDTDSVPFIVARE